MSVTGVTRPTPARLPDTVVCIRCGLVREGRSRDRSATGMCRDCLEVTHATVPDVGDAGARMAWMVWPILDDTRTLTELTREALPRLVDALQGGALRLAGRPVWRVESGHLHVSVTVWDRSEDPDGAVCEECGRAGARGRLCPACRRARYRAAAKRSAS